MAKPNNELTARQVRSWPISCLATPSYAGRLRITQLVVISCYASFFFMRERELKSIPHAICFEKLTCKVDTCESLRACLDTGLCWPRLKRSRLWRVAVAALFLTATLCGKFSSVSASVAASVESWTKHKQRCPVARHICGVAVCLR